MSWAKARGSKDKQTKGSAKSSGAKGDRAGGRQPVFSGDRAELAWEPSDAAWSQVSTGWRECPGVAQCPSGGECFAEAARQRAAKADVVVVNTHLYATSLAMGEADLLSPHDLVIFDEAHELEDIASAAFGFDISQARLMALARLARPLVADSSAAAAVEDGALLLGGVLRARLDQPLKRPLDEDVARTLGLLRERVNRLLEELRKAGRPGGLGAGAGGFGEHRSARGRASNEWPGGDPDRQKSNDGNRQVRDRQLRSRQVRSGRTRSACPKGGVAAGRRAERDPGAARRTSGVGRRS